ncbi:4-carboxy-2-hydroxymuconate semialdehyde dehydrogenase [Rhodoglobus vestalii]|uniref:4-carboxy-2-hydroxymuconate semialdehyde dehydrogenase n=1 Tax=Rhodoglobus vestalii TaxID=193384 RepID=A0A8H2PYQ3_9MICO|nr:Gfo/Idh/MocA family oxidoreductase [Rhodoglobus vestalii]TQO20574.1 4-carboxy-2-hydroxymuconate semialdehyde dehydrogenase [Rhodoglobus vestalii]
MTVNIAVVGLGAFGQKHLDALALIDDANIAYVGHSRMAVAEEFAEKYGAKAAFTDYAELLAQPDLDGVILATPTQMHHDQTIQALRAGINVEVEIPMADNLAGVQEIVDVQRETGLIAMAGHTRRFNPSHQYIHNRVVAGEFALQQLDVQTYFFRRSNMNALGQTRSWTDHLLWHHAAHTVDLFQYQTGEKIVKANAVQGPKNRELGIAMDMSIQLQTETGKICTLSLSFNNDGPLGTFFRYIGDTATYIARYDDLFTGKDEGIDLSNVAVSMNGIELQDREFVAAISENREPNSSVASVLPCYVVLDALQQQLDY